MRRACAPFGEPLIRCWRIIHHGLRSPVIHSGIYYKPNPAAMRLLEVLNAAGATNIMQAMLAIDGVDSPLLNWPEVARLTLARLRAEQLQQPNHPGLNELLQQLKQHPRIDEGDVDDRQAMGVVVPIRVRTPETTLSLFSIIAQFGSVQEVTMADVRIELFFPEDDVTVAYFALPQV